MVTRCLTLLLLSTSSALLLSPMPLRHAVLSASPALARPRVAAPVRAQLLDGSAMQLLADAAESTRPLTEEAIKAADGTIGWWGTYIKTVEDGIFTLHDTFSSAGIPGAYGLSIFCFVLAVKLITLPLNFQQLSSTSAMKAMKPQQELVRKWYGDNKDMLNMQTGLLFEKNNVNPLAGCLPALLQIPVFLGVYYSVTSIAKARIYTEGFLWIPSLSGPIADRREGISWLTEGWINGAPKFGWEDTLAYLTLPLILVVTQTVSLYLLGTFEQLEASEDSTSQTTGLVLRGLPFMLGWFAMNAPAGLGLYWVFNNILTTATTVTVKKLTEKEEYLPDVDVAALGPRRAPVELPEALSEEAFGNAAKAALAADGVVVETNTAASTA